MSRHLYGVGELVVRLRVSRARVRQIVERPDFPPAYDELTMGRVWRKDDVEAWIREHRPHMADDE